MYNEHKHFPKRTKEDGAIDWSMSALDIHNQIKALEAPYPNAFSRCGEATIFINRSVPIIVSTNFQPGEVVQLLDDGTFLVACADGLLQVLDYYTQDVHITLRSGMKFDKFEISQSANVIFDRFIGLFSNNRFPTPQNVLDMEKDHMRSAGISNPKIKYIKNIAEAFLNNSINTSNFKNLSNKDIMEQLTIIKGVGPWTVQMFLMFTLKRSDIFPTGDLGVRKGFKIYFKLKEIPDHETMLSKAKIWKPYRTIMAMYFWKVVDSSIEW